MAATFRVERTKGYTVMSNYHLRDKSLSLKATGLLSYMLSLPEDWDYTVAGLSSARGVGKSTVEGAIRELEAAGYIERHRLRNEDGTLGGTEYIIREQPQKAPEGPAEGINPQIEHRIQELSKPAKTAHRKANRPKPEKAEQAAEKNLAPIPSLPVLENPEQAYKVLNNKQSTKRTKYLSLHQVARENPMGFWNRIHEQIGYGRLAEEYGEERIDGIVELIVGTCWESQPFMSIGAKVYATQAVQERLLSLGPEEVEYVLDAIDRQTGPIRNMRAYLLAALFNAPATIDEYYRNRVNVDLASPSG